MTRVSPSKRRSPSTSRKETWWRRRPRALRSPRSTRSTSRCLPRALAEAPVALVVVPGIDRDDAGLLVDHDASTGPDAARGAEQVSGADRRERRAAGVVDAKRLLADAGREERQAHRRHEVRRPGSR